jgi:Protein of unknown function (DUF3667)
MSAKEPAAPANVVVPAASAIVAAAAGVVPVRCKNCDAVLLGRYCANCSQAADVHVPTTRELLHELLEGLTHSDSRLWRTLTTLWFKPGKLTAEFVAGKRVAYLPPFRLYLVLSVILFLMFSFIRTSGEAIRFDEAMKPGGAAAAPAAKRISSCEDVNFITFSAHPTWNPRIRHACEEIARDNGQAWLHVAVATLSKAMFIFLPLIAFLNMLMYWRPRYRYAEHLLFFVHVHAFYFSVAILFFLVIEAAGSWPRLAGVADVLETLLGWSLPVYTVLAMRRVFRRSWIGTLFKGGVLFFVYSCLFGLTVAAVVVYAAAQL